MSFLNKIKEANEQALFHNAAGRAEKKAKSKGKEYSVKDLLTIMKEIEVSINKTKKDGVVTDTFVEPVGDLDSHYIVWLHTGMIIKRQEEGLEIAPNSKQFYPEMLPANIRNFLKYDYYPIAEETEKQKSIRERIEGLIKDKKIVVDDNGFLDWSKEVIEEYQKTWKTPRVSKGVIFALQNKIYRKKGRKLEKKGFPKAISDKYIGMIVSSNDGEEKIKKFTVAEETKSPNYEKGTKGYLIEFGKKIAIISYFLKNPDGSLLIDPKAWMGEYPEEIEEIKEEVKKNFKPNVRGEFKDSYTWFNVYIETDKENNIKVKTNAIFHKKNEPIFVTKTNTQTGKLERVNEAWKEDVVIYTHKLKKWEKLQDTKEGQAVIFYYNAIKKALEDIKPRTKGEIVEVVEKVEEELKRFGDAYVGKNLVVILFAEGKGRLRLIVTTKDKYKVYVTGIKERPDYTLIDYDEFKKVDEELKEFKKGLAKMLKHVINREHKVKVDILEEGEEVKGNETKNDYWKILDSKGEKVIASAEKGKSIKIWVDKKETYKIYRDGELIAETSWFKGYEDGSYRIYNQGIEDWIYVLDNWDIVEVFNDGITAQIIKKSNGYTYSIDKGKEVGDFSKENFGQEIFNKDWSLNIEFSGEVLYNLLEGYLEDLKEGEEDIDLSQGKDKENKKEEAPKKEKETPKFLDIEVKPFKEEVMKEFIKGDTYFEQEAKTRDLEVIYNSNLLGEDAQSDLIEKYNKIYDKVEKEKAEEVEELLKGAIRINSLDEID